MSHTKFKLNHKLFAGKYQVLDEHNILVCEAKKSSFSPSHRTVLYDSFGEEVFEIRRKLFSLSNIFTISSGGEPVYRLKSSKFSFRPKVFVEALKNRDAFMIQGDLFGMEYAFYRYKKAFAMVSKKMWTFSDHYGIAIEDSEDELLIISVVIALDIMRRRKKRRAAS